MAAGGSDRDAAPEERQAPLPGDVAAYLVATDSGPRWEIRIVGTLSLGLEETTASEVEAIVTTLAGRSHRSGWVEDAPDRWRRIVFPRTPSGA